MPIIFAQSILFIPSTILSFFPENTSLQWISSQLFREQSYIYALTYSTLIVFFTYFYTAVAFNPKDVADNMKNKVDLSLVLGQELQQQTILKIY